MVSKIVWRKATKEYLEANRLCYECCKRHYIVPAMKIGHIKNPKGNSILFWDMNNWKALCVSCHARLYHRDISVIPDPIPSTAKFYTVA